MTDWKEEMVEYLASDEADPVQTEKALTLKYQNRPNSVFKYRIDDCYSRKNLENDCVWITSPTSYNDPYDSSISVSIDKLARASILEEVKSFIANELGSSLDMSDVDSILNDPNPAMSLGKLILEKVDLVSSEQQESLLQFLSEVLQSAEKSLQDRFPHQGHKDSLKVCSFSETHRSIIMWSHYGDQHRGFCIEYGTDALPESDLFLRLLYPVIYSDKLFDATKHYRAFLHNRHTFNLLFPAVAALYKSCEWRYEKEWRLIIPVNLVPKASAWRVPTPKRVHLGCRMPLENKEQIVEICKKKHIDVHQMHLEKDSFALRSELLVAAD
jgi:hypothetical protein